MIFCFARRKGEKSKIRRPHSIVDAHAFIQLAIYLCEYWAMRLNFRIHFFVCLFHFIRSIDRSGSCGLSSPTRIQFNPMEKNAKICRARARVRVNTGMNA